MSSIIRAVALALGLALLALPASATLLTYSDLTSFQNANTDVTFSNISFAQQSYSSPYTDSSTGVVFSINGGLAGIAAPTGWPAGNALRATGTTTPFTLSLAVPSTDLAVGFYAGVYNMPYQYFQVDITNANTDTYSHQYYMVDPTVPFYLGVRSDSAITSFNISTSQFDQLAISNMQVGTGVLPTPDINTMMMIGTGLIGFGFLKRRT